MADATTRFCTAAEAEIYFVNLKNGGNSLKLNRNCNSSHWAEGCEPGWACSLDNEDHVDLENSRDIPARGSNCAACCEGFFCPQGLTCMMRKSLRLETVLVANLFDSFNSTCKVTCIIVLFHLLNLLLCAYSIKILIGSYIRYHMHSHLNGFVGPCSLPVGFLLPACYIQRGHRQL